MIDAYSTNSLWRLITLSTVLAFGLCLLPLSTEAAVTPDDPGNFITTWNTENSGPSNDDQITIPGAGGGYSYEIYWENVASSTMNGTTSLITSSSHTLTFPEPGIYEVQASGTFPRISFDGGGDKEKILTIEQWGDNAWTSMTSAFHGAVNLRIPATDAPDLSGATSIYQMFFGATSFNDPIDHWDTSNVTNFGQVFRQATAFNQPLNSWDVSNGIEMSAMFWDAYVFNQPLDTWDVSNVTGMESLFNDARAFNQPLNSWDVSSSTNMRAVFYQSDFNQPLDSWDVSNVEDMLFMFRDTPFNQDLSTWDVGNVISMSGMFRDTPFNQDLSTWDVGNVTSMSGMFINARLSQSNQDATFTGWAAQALQNDVSLHIGVKDYSSTGATALQTLRDTYNWTISEQYQAQYRSGLNAVLIGTSDQAPLNSGATTNEVRISPSDNCTFQQWSDGSTDNPRTDIITDNLNVTAEVACTSSGGSTSAGGRAAALERQGKTEEAAAVRERFGLDNRTTTSTPSTYQPPETMEESMNEVKRLPETIETIIANDPSPETIRSLIAVLLQLVESLMQLMAQGVEQEG